MENETPELTDSAERTREKQQRAMLAMSGVVIVMMLGVLFSVYA